ncbi:MAG: SlyX family protein [Halopseudomonas yangmingensis]|uniref:Protein SlyX homolog n=1 Tax=Halopseudomonas yangmingensis TaxID=1720063 RepID=A0A1I4NGT4_9GAMM|nr:SlyX family protein [Halopseudomonas yangmingensis]SFM14520.1 SlyX protein [Halopseudomonas yangmingensis]
MSAEYEARIAELEMRLSFQEDTLQALNDALGHQQLEIDRMREIVRLMMRRQEELAGAMPEDVVEERPPHY